MYYIHVYSSYMSELAGFEPQPRDTSMLDVCNAVFDKAIANQEKYHITTTEDDLGMVQEQVTYQVPYGTGSSVGVRVMRPSVDTAEFLALAEGTIDEKPRAEVWVHAPRSFLFKLANDEKYFADAGFFRVVVLSDGTYLDVFSMAFKTVEESGVERSIPTTVGSMLRPLPVETDWTIQEIIFPQ